MTPAIASSSLNLFDIIYVIEALSSPITTCAFIFDHKKEAISLSSVLEVLVSNLRKLFFIDLFDLLSASLTLLPFISVVITRLEGSKKCLAIGSLSGFVE